MQIGKIAPGGMPLAREWNALADAYNFGSTGRSGSGQRSRIRIVGKNSSGSDRGRYECMQITGVSTTLNTNGRVDLVFTLGTAAADEPVAVLVEPIASGQFGTIIIDGLALAKVSAASDSAHRYAVPAAAGTFTPQEDETSFRLLSAPSTSSTRLVPILLGSGAGGTDETEFRTFTLTTDVVAGSPSTATANITAAHNQSTSIATGVTLYGNYAMFDDLETGAQGTCVKQHGYWFAVNAPCENGIAQWLDGSGAPGSGLGEAGDYYLDTASGDVYKKT